MRNAIVVRLGEERDVHAPYPGVDLVRADGTYLDRHLPSITRGGDGRSGLVNPDHRSHTCYFDTTLITCSGQLATASRALLSSSSFEIG